MLLRLAFDGGTFQGTQRQHGAPTVHGAILEALNEAGILAKTPRLRAHGRLDAGTSALDHPVALDVDADVHTVARSIAGATTGIVPWAGAEVPSDHDPRFAARSRTYRYVFPFTDAGLASRIQDAWALFDGRHDVREFARIDRERAQRSVVQMAVRSWQGASCVFLEVTAPRFLRHQVRRMVGAARCIARGEVEPDRVRKALEGGNLGTYEVASPTGLLLARVGLSAPWVALPEARRIGVHRLRPRWERVLQHTQVLEELRGVGGVTRPG